MTGPDQEAPGRYGLSAIYNGVDEDLGPGRVRVRVRMRASKVPGADSPALLDSPVLVDSTEPSVPGLAMPAHLVPAQATGLRVAARLACASIVVLVLAALHWAPGISRAAIRQSAPEPRPLENVDSVDAQGSPGLTSPMPGLPLSASQAALGGIQTSLAPASMQAPSSGGGAGLHAGPAASMVPLRLADRSWTLAALGYDGALASPMPAGAGLPTFARTGRPADKSLHLVYVEAGPDGMPHLDAGMMVAVITPLGSLVLAQRGGGFVDLEHTHWVSMVANRDQPGRMVEQISARPSTR